MNNRLNVSGLRRRCSTVLSVVEFVLVSAVGRMGRRHVNRAVIAMLRDIEGIACISYSLADLQIRRRPVRPSVRHYRTLPSRVHTATVLWGVASVPAWAWLCLADPKTTRPA